MNVKFVWFLDSSFDNVRNRLWNHRDAVDDRTNAQAKITTCWKTFSTQTVKRAFRKLLPVQSSVICGK